ncbi:Oidioi.mRNA.OKI2018_I69.chr1.g1860.t1.cds [Oikopleura dioica]|uniref:Oidioi.mRNA.OKI2018_I69.chr1.g1860.t1.cds n=1 Tax=Oikopleura dioica TaxID=34765 RepID=A0ABN7SU96_OIKDI|nr:Oidioi.mRNA.OKI2018_I69.chr1.g1860.t1.cds [Oikopleura dioica]
MNRQQALKPKLSKEPRVSHHREEMKEPQNHNDEYLDARGFQILDADYLGRSKERLDEQLQSIKTRISSTLMNYEQDMELCEEAEIEQVCKFHWASDIEAVEEYIKNDEFRRGFQEDVQVLVVGRKTVDRKRTHVLRGILQALEQSAEEFGSEDMDLASEYDSANGLKRLQNALNSTQQLIDRLDGLAPDILNVISNSKSDVKQTQNRNLQTKLNKIRKKMKTLTNTIAKSKEDYDDLLTESMTRQAKIFLLDQRIEELSEKIKDFDKREAKVKSDHKKEVKEILKTRDLVLEAQEDKILNLESYIAELKKENQKIDETKEEERETSPKVEKLPLLVPAKPTSLEKGPSLITCPYPLVGKTSKGAIESSLVKQISREDISVIPSKVISLGKSSSDLRVLPNLTASTVESTSSEINDFCDMKEDVDITLHEVAQALASPSQKNLSSNSISLQNMSSQTDIQNSASDTIRRLEPKSRPIGAVAAKLEQVKRVKQEMRAFNFFAEFVNKLNETCELPNSNVELSPIDGEELKKLTLAELRKTAKEFCEAADHVRTRALEMVDRTMRRNKVEVKYIQEQREKDKTTLTRMRLPQKSEEELIREENSSKREQMQQKHQRKSVPLDPLVDPNPAEVQSVILRNKSEININFPSVDLGNCANLGKNSRNRSSAHQIHDRQISKSSFHHGPVDDINHDGDNISICSMAETALDPACLEFAVDWVDRLKKLPQAPEIFEKLEKITLLEGRRKSMKTEFNKAILQIQEEVNKMVKEASLNLVKEGKPSFKPDLLGLEVKGKRKIVTLRVNNGDQDCNEGGSVSTIPVAIDSNLHLKKSTVTPAHSSALSRVSKILNQYSLASINPRKYEIHERPSESQF